MPREPISIHPTCIICSTSAANEPDWSPTPVVIDGSATIVCGECRTKARRGSLSAQFQSERVIRMDGVALRRDPRCDVARYVESLYRLDAIRVALEAETNLWRFLDILDDRITADNAPGGDLVRAKQPFRQAFIDKLIAMPTDGELHLLVTRGQTRFGYSSKEVEKQVRDARTVDHNVQLQIIEEPDPWQDPVDGAALAEEIAATIRRYVWAPPAKIDTVALYVIFTHAIEAFSIAPILGIESPAPECGKSTLATLIRRLVYRGLPCSNITGAALFRAITKWHPTFLLDEADSFLTDKRNEDLRGIIDSGHTRELAFVIRAGSSEENHEPKLYSTWCPKVIAVIGRLPHTVESRTIKIKLKRMKPSEAIDKLRDHHLPALRPLHRQIVRWVADHAEALRLVRTPITLEGLGNRANDNWDPLLYIADLLGGTWPERGRQAALGISGLAVSTEQIAGIELLADLQRFFQDKFKPDAAGKLPEPKAATERILGFLTDDAERPWATWRRGKPLDAKGLARLLNPFDVKSKNLKMKREGTNDEYVVRGYRGDDPNLIDAWASYPSSRETPDSPATAATSRQSRIVTPQNSPATEGSGSGTENGNSPNDSASVAAVAGEQTVSGGERGVGADNGHRPTWTDVDPEVFAQNFNRGRGRVA
jgi:Protein of unknown function (DUF3631)